MALPHTFADGPGNTASGVEVTANDQYLEALALSMEPAFSTWKTKAWGGAVLNPSIANGAGTWLLWGPAPLNSGTQNSPGAVGSVGSGGASFIYDPADLLAGSRTTKMRLRVRCTTNSVAPSVTYTAGLYPVTAFGGGSGTPPTVATLGTVVTGSTVVFASPGAATNTVSLSSEFNAPASGNYVFAVATSALANANSTVLFVVELQYRQI